MVVYKIIVYNMVVYKIQKGLLRNPYYLPLVLSKNKLILRKEFLF